MANTVLRRIEPMSLAKVMALVYGFIGLIAGAIFALFSLVGAGIGAAMSHAGDDSGMGALLGGLFGVGAIIFLPLFYAVFGFIGGLIMAAVFNLVSRWVGGLQIELG